VCASVRFADNPFGQPLWLTDRRFLFTRRHSGAGKLVVSVPTAGGTLHYDLAAQDPHELCWTNAEGTPGRESFRPETWRNSLDSGRAAVTGGATGGIEGAILGGAIDTATRAVAGMRRVGPRDETLHATLSAALKAPNQVRPIDLTVESLNRVGTRWLIGIWMSLMTAVLLAVASYAVVSFWTNQAYQAAALCGSVPVPDCRSRQTAVVTAYHGAHESYASMYCDLTMKKPDGSSATVHLLAYNLCGDNPTGQGMTLEYWRGSVVAVIAPGVSKPHDREAQETEKTPAYNWRAGAFLTGAVSLLWLLFGSISLAEVIRWRKRRSLLQASARAAGYLS
jgi:hypothetical protein